MERLVYISSDADPRLTDWFEGEGYRVISVSSDGIVSSPVSCHPDMFMCRLGIDESVPLIMCRQFAGSVDPAIADGTLLSPGYPCEIAFNAACTGKYFIHNLKYTAPELLDAARSLGMTLVDVRQGYAKCSIVIVDEVSIITYDEGVGRSCERAGMDVLMVEPGHVRLPGYDTGFIGGASGRVNDTLYFNGDLRAHPDFGRIRDFIAARGVKVKWFEDWPLTDIGSII